MTEASCPSADRLLDFAAGSLSDDAAGSIEAHIDRCSTCRATLSSLARGTAPSSSFGRYRLDTVLGSGGMGIVYRAWDPQLARPVAIKVVKRAGDDAAGRARLVREAQSLARLSHPNVCHVYDVGSEGDEVWVAMELVDGANLRQWAAAHPSPDELLPMLLGAAEGLAAAHAADIIHRDVKPENVLVTRDRRAVVTDFGLARVEVPIDPSASTVTIQPKLTATGAIAGTPAYLAPEQLTGEPLDARVDQFAWAVMAWELLAGVRPFPIAADSRLDAILVGVKPPPRLPRHLAAPLSRALAAAPGDRFPSMRELIDALRRPPARERRPLRPAVVAGIAAALAVGSTLLVWKLVKSPPAVRTSDVRPTDPAVPDVRYPDARSPDVQEPDLRAIAPEPRAPDSREPDAGGGPIVTPRPKQPKPDVGVADGSAKPAPKAIPGTPPNPPGTPPHPPATPGAPAPLDLSNLPARLKYLPDRAHATIEMFCGIPLDPARPGPGVRKPVVDWGKVTRRELVTAKLAGRDHPLLMYEVQGARAIYRFDGSTWSNTIGILDVAPGGWIALCEEDRSELYEMPPAWRFPTSRVVGVLPLTAPPRVAEIAHLDPLHLSAIALKTSGSNGKLGFAADRRHLVRAKVEAADGPRWQMGGWWLEVPPGARGARLVDAGRWLWFVVEQPTFEDPGDGGKPRLVVRAAAVVDELLPH